MINPSQWRTHLVFAWAMALLLVAGLARGESPSPTFVAVKGEDDASVVSLFQATLGAETGDRLGAETIGIARYATVRETPKSAPDGVYFLVDLSSETTWRLEIHLLPQHTIWRRTLPGPARDPAAPEAAVSILTSAAISLQQERSEPPAMTSWVQEDSKPTESPDTPERTERFPDREQEEPESPLAVSGSEQQSRKPWGSIEAGAGYSLITWGSGMPLTHGPQATLAYRAPRGWFMGMSGAFHPARTIDSESGTFEVQVVPLSVRGGYSSSGDVQWMALVGARADQTRRLNSTSTEGRSVSEENSRLSWGLEVGPGLRVQPWPHLSFGLFTLVEYFPSEHTFLADSEEIARRSSVRFSSSFSVTAHIR